MQEGKDVKMKLFPRVLPVDIPLRSLSITDSANMSKAKLMRKKKTNFKASGTSRSFLYSMFNLSLSDVVDVKENMLLFTFLRL